MLRMTSTRIIFNFGDVSSTYDLMASTSKGTVHKAIVETTYMLKQNMGISAIVKFYKSLQP